MRYTFLWALCCFYLSAQAQYNSTRELLQDTNIVWAARGFDFIKSSSSRYIRRPENPEGFFQPLKYISANPVYKNNEYGEDLDFLWSETHWAAQSNRYFADPAMQQPASFAMYGQIANQTTNNYDNQEPKKTNPPLHAIQAADIDLYKLGYLVYFDKKKNCFGFLLEYIAPILKDQDMVYVSPEKRKPCFYFAMQNHQLAQNVDISQPAITRAFYCKFKYQYDPANNIKSSNSFLQVVERYLAYLRQAPNASSYLDIVQSEVQQELFKGRTYPNLQRSLGYKQVIGDYVRGVDSLGYSTGMILEKEADLTPIPTEDFVGFSFTSLIYYYQNPLTAQFSYSMGLLYEFSGFYPPIIYTNHRY